MICVRLNGGIGNQLFQYAAGRALATKHDTSLLLDVTQLNIHFSKATPRSYELYLFNHQAGLAYNSDLCYIQYLYRNYYLSRWLTPWHPVLENNNLFDTSFFDLPDNSYLVGYWQSYKYFKYIEKQLYIDIAPVEKLSDMSKAIQDKIISSTSVALHVRRGDYVTLPSASKYHGILPLSYYVNAIARVSSQIISPRFFVFSDDPVWCRCNLPLDERSTIYVTHNTGNDTWQDLWLMGYCHNHIIANSSFSWWGAWFADQRYYNSQRLVISPARWFTGSSHQYSNDRFPLHWIIQV